MLWSKNTRMENLEMLWIVYLYVSIMYENMLQKGET